jgi:hypothetical protein
METDERAPEPPAENPPDETPSQGDEPRDDPSEDPGPRGNPDVDEETLRKKQEEQEGVSGN